MICDSPRRRSVRLAQRKIRGLAVEGGSSPPVVPRAGGPWVQLACVCERVLQEQDGVLSLIRVVDRLMLGATGPEPPDEMPKMPVNFTLLVALKGGAARGRFQVRLTLEAPSGERMPTEATLPVLFEGEDRGVNLVVPVGLELDQEGVYWFDVWLGPRYGQPEELLTRVPLRIVYQPQTAPGPPQPTQ
jgi:hypothetical protein